MSGALKGTGPHAVEALGPSGGARGQQEAQDLEDESSLLSCIPPPHLVGEEELSEPDTSLPSLRSGSCTQ